MESYYVLDEAIAYIEEHLEEEISPDEVAAFCHYSVSNLKYLFRKVFQYGIMDYVNRRKLTQAACRLVKTNESVCSVALSYGYKSQEAFTRSFARMWRETPGAYRKNRYFYGLFPRQKFFCDECGVFRRSFDLSELMTQLKARDCSFVLCFDIIGIRWIKTCFGREAGEAAVLEALQKIEIEAGECASLYRIAGDKFAVNLGNCNYETCRELILRILAHNGQSFIYKENPIQLSMFAGIVFIRKEEVLKSTLFQVLDTAISHAHDRLFRKYTDNRGMICFDRKYNEASGFFQASVNNICRGRKDGMSGYLASIPVEEIQYRFFLDEEVTPIKWKTRENRWSLFFPDGENWYKRTVYSKSGHVISEHFHIIRNLKLCSEDCLSFTLLYLEVIRTLDGRILIINDGELKETFHDGNLSQKEYRSILAKGKTLKKQLEKKRE